MQGWNDFYMAVAGASAALTGLIFVGISINLTKILSVPQLPERALLSLTLLLNVLVVSLLFLVPDQSTKALGIELDLTSVISWMLILRLDLKIFASKSAAFRRQYRYNLGTNQLACILFIAADISLTMGNPLGNFLIVPAVLLSVIKAVIDGWVLLIEINR